MANNMIHKISVLWSNNSSELFKKNKYSRAHKWILDGGAELAASSSPYVVPVPLSDESAIDPEEAFVASLSSCHMLFFLSIAAAHGFIVERYEDNAEGEMGEDKKRVKSIEKINLNPKVKFSGIKTPSAEKIARFHQLAHSKCFIANSVRSKIYINNN